MKHRKIDKPTGCVYARKSRYWWRGKLPGETKARARKITPRGSTRAVLATPDNLQLAYEIVWSWWEDAAAQAEGRKRQTVSVAQLVAIYLAHADEYYRRKDGTPTGEKSNIEHATRVLTSKFGNLAADAIDVEHIEQVQKAMIGANGDGLARSTINKRLNIIKRMYRWAARKKIVPPSSWHAVDVVENLKLGRSKARETSKVTAADEWSVDRTLEVMPPTLWRMVMLHRLAGFRSTELCIMRPCDIDRSTDVWIYTPEWHKEQHLDQSRRIPLGPVAQWILAPLLERDGTSYCFKPAEVLQERWHAMRSARKSRVQPSQVSRKKAAPQLRRHERYDRRSYYTAIQHAWQRASKAIIAAADSSQVMSEDLGPNPPSNANGMSCPTLAHWHPHQLRHSFLTKVRRIFDADHARASGGHSSLDATEIYLEKDMKAATDVAREIG